MYDPAAWHPRVCWVRPSSHGFSTSESGDENVDQFDLFTRDDSNLTKSRPKHRNVNHDPIRSGMSDYLIYIFTVPFPICPWAETVARSYQMPFPLLGLRWMDTRSYGSVRWWCGIVDGGKLCSTIFLVGVVGGPWDRSKTRTRQLFRVIRSERFWGPTYGHRGKVEARLHYPR